MSNFNLRWLQENFNTDSIVIFDIGCADLNDTYKMKQALPSATFYAFDCAEVWKERNITRASEIGVFYIHKAMSDKSGTLTFYPSDELDNVEWPWSGSICTPGKILNTERWKWGKSYLVEATSLKDFCLEYNVAPDVIHIDAQGAEYKIFSNMDTIRPSCIWTEISEFQTYETGSTYEKFNQLMQDYGYEEKFKNSCDALYVLNTANLSEYYHDG